MILFLVPKQEKSANLKISFKYLYKLELEAEVNDFSRLVYSSRLPILDDGHLVAELKQLYGLRK